MKEVLATMHLRRCFEDFLQKRHHLVRLDFQDRLFEFQQNANDDLRTRVAQACSIYNTIQLETGLTNAARAGIQRHLFGGRGGTCGEGVSSLPAKLFAPALHDVVEALEQDFEGFFGSHEFDSCRGKTLVQADLSSFGRLSSQYCTSERESYERGSRFRRHQTIEIIKRMWAEQCHDNPSFIPKEIVALQRDRDHYVSQPGKKDFWGRLKSKWDELLPRTQTN